MTSKRWVGVLLLSAGVAALGGCAAGGSSLPPAPTAAPPQELAHVLHPEAALPANIDVTFTNLPIAQKPGTTVVYSCRIKVGTWLSGRDYALTAWASPSSLGSFPLYRSPAPSLLAWRVPDLSPTFRPIANGGAPGQLLWTGTGARVAHCIDLQLTVPKGTTPGSTQPSIQLNLLARAGGSLFQTNSVTTIGFTAQVQADR